jgi:hypothetical protein
MRVLVNFPPPIVLRLIYSVAASLVSFDSFAGHVCGLHREDVVRAAAAERSGVRATCGARGEGELRAPARVDHQDHEARAVPGAGRVRARHILAGDRLLHRGARHDVWRGLRLCRRHAIRSFVGILIQLFSGDIWF